MEGAGSGANRIALARLRAVPDRYDLNFVIAEAIDDDEWPYRRQLPSAATQTWSAAFWELLEAIARSDKLNRDSRCRLRRVFRDVAMDIGEIS
jgi:hypothetical protein